MLRIQNTEVNIAIVNVYFGTFPKYFPLWLKSASYNRHINFLIFSDAIYEDLPENVQIIPFSMADMKRRAEDNLGFAVTLDAPYKCCDYKVIYGILFRKELQGYDYWGHCDLDLFWGDLESCFIENRITKYDRFFHLGHLSLYKNNDTVNHYFMLDGGRHDYRQVFTTNKICTFDEVPGIVQIYRKHGFPMFAEKKYADITRVYKRFRLSEKTIIGETIQNYREQVFLWDQGHVYRLYRDAEKIYKEEYAYLHFQKRPNFELPIHWQDCLAFAVTDAGIFSVDGLTEQEILMQHARCRGCLTEQYEYIRFRAMEYINAAKRRLAAFMRKKG